MLLRLRIDNFALVEHLEISFEAGFNVLTGETGTGKSIIIDAVEAALGGRAGSDMVRTGADKALIEAEFQLPILAELDQVLNELGVELDDDRTLIMTRTISNTSRNTYRINGYAATSGMFKKVGEYLIDIHGQHDNYALMKSSRHLHLLDSFGHDHISNCRQEFSLIYHKYLDVTKQLADIQAAQRDRARRIDILQFQINEINVANLRNGEEEALLEERKLLANAEKLHGLASRAYDTLKAGTGRQGAALDAVAEAVRATKDIATIDDKLQGLSTQATEAFYQLEDLAEQLREYADQLLFEPTRLELIEERLETLRQLKRKYGDSVEDILVFNQQAQVELNQLLDSEQIATDLAGEIDQLNRQLVEKGANLSLRRQEVAAVLEQSITQELRHLHMPHIQFKVHFETLSVAGSTGFERVEFLISPNPGEPLKPLAKIASGGELSRIMLALKVILAQADRISTLIFDEVDAGLGGRAAQAVGEKLAQLGRDFQILSVTHSPQVTSFADHHLQITKEVLGERTRTSVRSLAWSERQTELARMLGGAQITALTLEHASEMLLLAKQQKKLPIQS